MPKQRLALIGIILTAAYLRFFNLGSPKELVFDEVYYVNGAQDYLRDGVETAAGKAEFVVHPPVGKWMIALGIKIFGDNPFGWRFSAALIGTISIFLIYLVAKKLFHSEKFGLIAAALMSLDGLHLVMSRTALLDIFLMFFILLSFLALLYDRHWLAALSLGLALGTKWSALYFIAAIMIYYLVKERKIPFQYIISIPIVYITTWFGWFTSGKGWSRNFSTNPIISWLHYHGEILNFHTGLTTQHSYQANPWSWLILGRPTSFFYSTPKDCGASSCSREVLAMGTPLLWWSATICIFVTVGYYIYQREKSALLILIGLGANYLPWFFFQKRTMFYFYSIAFEPFLILCVVYVMSKARARNPLIYSSIALIALVFLYFLPLFVGLTLPYDSWYDRMWLPSWI